MEINFILTTRRFPISSSILSLSCLASARSTRSRAIQLPVHRFQIETFRIVAVAEPFQKFRLLTGLFRGFQGFKNVAVARETTAVFRRAGARQPNTPDTSLADQTAASFRRRSR